MEEMEIEFSPRMDIVVVRKLKKYVKFNTRTSFNILMCIIASTTDEMITCALYPCPFVKIEIMRLPSQEVSIMTSQHPSLSYNAMVHLDAKETKGVRLAADFIQEKITSLQNEYKEIVKAIELEEGTQETPVQPSQNHIKTPRAPIKKDNGKKELYPQNSSTLFTPMDPRNKIRKLEGVNLFAVKKKKEEENNPIPLNLSYSSVDE